MMGCGPAGVSEPAYVVGQERWAGRRGAASSMYPGWSPAHRRLSTAGGNMQEPIYGARRSPSTVIQWVRDSAWLRLASMDEGRQLRSRH